MLEYLKYANLLKLFIYLFIFIYLLVALSLPCYIGFSLAAMMEGYSLIEMHGLLTEVASLVAEHKL